MASTVTITSTFGRKKSMGNYNMAEASVVVSQTFDGDVSPEDVDRVAQEQFIHAKCRVLQELGLEFAQDAETMLIVEAFTPMVEVVAAPARQMTQGPPRSFGGGSASGGGGQLDKDLLWRDLMDNPGGWENVASDNPKAPTFRSLTVLQPGTKFRVGLWSKDAPSWFASPFADSDARS